MGTTGLDHFGVEADAVTYNTLISASCKLRKLVEVCQGPELFIQRGLKPDCITYRTLIKGLCQIRKAQEALQLLRKMPIFGGRCKPNLLIFNIAIDGLCKDGFLNAAVLISAQMSKQSIKICS